MLAETLVEILVCPRTKQPLIYFPKGEANQTEAEAFLLAPGPGLRYRIEDGVPVLLSDEAEELPADAIARLVARAKELGLRVPA